MGHISKTMHITCQSVFPTFISAASLLYWGDLRESNMLLLMQCTSFMHLM